PSASDPSASDPSASDPRSAIPADTGIAPVVDSLLDLFAAADGGLPEICIQGLQGGEVTALYGVLRGAARFLVGKPVYRDRRDRLDKPLDGEANPASLVVSGEAEPFHFLTRGIRVEGVDLPDLGVFVLPNAVALDYERGPWWGRAQVTALFSLLRGLFARAARPRVAYDADTGRDEGERFARALVTVCGLSAGDGG
ncbi:MAG: hypothetical protein GX442_08570, partial [Candidatus Riflebacteria bacterium]|nr:hypothetical protein [Candidatus Riflebacteria bacterium]